MVFGARPLALRPHRSSIQAARRTACVIAKHSLTGCIPLVGMFAQAGDNTSGIRSWADGRSAWVSVVVMAVSVTALGPLLLAGVLMMLEDATTQIRLIHH